MVADTPKPEPKEVWAGTVNYPLQIDTSKKNKGNMKEETILFPEGTVGSVMYVEPDTTIKRKK